MNPHHPGSRSDRSDASYRALVNNLPVGVFRLTAEGRITAANPAAAQLLGFASEENLIDLLLADLLLEPSAWPAVLDGLQTKKDIATLQLRRGNRTAFWSKLSGTPVRDQSGRLLFIDGTIEDVSKQQKEKETVRQQALYQQSLQDIMLAMIRREDPLKVIEIVLNRTITLMRTIHGFFYSYDETTDRLILRVGSGIYQHNIGYAVQKGQGMVGKVWQKQAPLTIDDYQAWPGRHPDPIWDAVRSAAGVPIQSKEKFLGVIGFLHTEGGRPIEPHAFDLLKRFADLVSIVLDNAQLYAQLEEELQERKRIQVELTKSEERYRSVVEDLTEFILRWTPDGQIIFANDAYCRYKNKTHAQIIASNVDDLYSAPALEQAREIITRLNPGHPLETNDILTYRPDSQPIWEEWTDRGIFDENQELVEIQSVGRNITERKLAEKALGESEYRFRSFFNSNPEGIILVDLDGKILDANKSLLKFTGYRLEELQTVSYKRLTHPRFHDLIDSNIESLTKGLLRDEVVEIEYLAKDGRHVPVEVRGWVITDEESSPLAFGGFIRDITHEKMLAADKASLEKQLQQIQKMEAIGTLAGGIAHDFNNILAGILGYAELAYAEIIEGQAPLKHYLSGVLSACHRARSLVQQILKFSRHDDAQLAPLPVAPLLKEAIKLLKSTFPATIQIHEEITPTQDKVIADATQLHQIIMNLGTNAYHAMRDTGGSLTFALENLRLVAPKKFLTLSIPPGAYLKLSVKDTGPGIAPKVLDRIFEPYFTTKEMQEGTGLGLSVTFGIVKNLNGLIEVEQTSPGMTIFAVYLPLAAQDITDDRDNVQQLLPLGNNEAILCVDDERVFLEVVQKHLEGLGYRVTSAQSSIKALELFKRDPTGFDLLLTDQTMPEMTGIQLITEIRKINLTIPVILCTGYSETVTARTTEEFGINGFLMKPVPLNELAQIVSEVLRTPSPAPQA